ncbi:MAG TPA: diacylglycerol kinase family protein [Candidatus Bathyarchaeia archaeon]|nr:diacylglycerol kinase family protein [Candidatus Bathyarchaeia archaeon]
MKIICNPATYGGKARKTWPDVVKALKDEGFDFEVEWTKGTNDAIRITKESIDDHDIIIAYGGDGTINEIVTAIGQTDFKTTLGIIPAGRGNDNAFSLRQTDKIEDIVEMLKNKQTRIIDCIEIDDGKRYCLGVAGAGIDAFLAEKVIGKSTRMSYNIGLLKAFFSYRPRQMKIDVDDGRIIRDLKCLSVMIGNGQRVGNKKMVSPNAVIDDGLLDINIIGNTGIFESIVTSRKLGDGSYITHPKVEVIRGKQVVLSSESKKKIPAHAMGELLGPLPHKFVCLHKKLKVLRMSDAVLKREGWHNANAFSENIKMG